MKPHEAEQAVDVPPTPALAVRGVTGGYGETIVVRDVDMEVPSGSVTALLGANGAGKTTTLKMLSGLIRPTAGTIAFDGQDVTDEPAEVRAARGMCSIPEGRGIYPSLTVLDNLVMQCAPGRVEESVELAAEAFPRLGERIRQRAGTLSGGEQQMLALAAAYVRDPRLIVVDEPSLGLAPIIVDEVFDFLDRLRGEGVSMLVVDQFVGRVLKLATHAYVMRRGSIVFSGPASEIPEDAVFAQYIGA